MLQKNPVIISGSGCVSAAGNTLEETLKTLEAGIQNCIAPKAFITNTPHPVFFARLPYQVQGWAYDLAWPVDIHKLELCNRTIHLAAFALDQALAEAGFRPGSVNTLRVGVCIGTSVGASLDFFDWYTHWHAVQQGYFNANSNPPPPKALDELRAFRTSNTALALAQLFGFSGPTQTVTNACSSGADAIAIAAGWIRNGWCDIAVAGGADALAYITYMGFKSLKLTSPEPCKPFDKFRQGLNLGEGAGIMVFESASSLAQRKQRALGTLLGYGTCTDAHHLTAPHPEGIGLKKAFKQALHQAGLQPSSLAFVNAHGTATPTNDAAEGTFLNTMLPATPVIATKGCTGHTLGAAGALEAVITLGHLNQGFLPPSPGFAEADPAIGLVPVNTPLSIEKTTAMSQSLAFGGNNSILIFGKGEQKANHNQQFFQEAKHAYSA